MLDRRTSHTRRGGGFTLIELLVVIAIIGILAAMLFPVFARARESARKTQCLANVKNIAMAIQIYLTDYDRLPPADSDPTAASFFYSVKNNDCGYMTDANPYLRWPVILDEYIKSREVWQCPSARLVGGAISIVPSYYTSGSYTGWVGYWANWKSTWTSDQSGACPCSLAWPPGWGGEVTDSFLQGRRASDYKSGVKPGAGVFWEGVGCNEPRRGTSTSEISDSARYVIAGDCGANPTDYFGSSMLALPDTCAPNCCWEPSADDLSNCPWSSDCSISFKDRADASAVQKKGRHMGGSNIGFADGHAKWMNALAILAQSPRNACGCWGGGVVERDLLGMSLYGVTSAGGSEANGIAAGDTSKPKGCGFPSPILY